MAKTAQAPAYDDGKTYEVKLLEVVTFERVKYKPLPVHEMTGRVLNGIVAQYGAGVLDAVNEKG